MTHVELIEKILADFEKEWKEDPTKDEDVENFRRGMKYAYWYLLVVLKNGDEWTYED